MISILKITLLIQSVIALVIIWDSNIFFMTNEMEENGLPMFDALMFFIRKLLNGSSSVVFVTVSIFSMVASAFIFYIVESKRKGWGMGWIFVYCVCSMNIAIGVVFPLFVKGIISSDANNNGKKNNSSSPKKKSPSSFPLFTFILFVLIWIAGWTVLISNQAYEYWDELFMGLNLPLITGVIFLTSYQDIGDMKERWGFKKLLLPQLILAIAGGVIVQKFGLNAYNALMIDQVGEINSLFERGVNLSIWIDIISFQLGAVILIIADFFNHHVNILISIIMIPVLTVFPAIGLPLYLAFRDFFIINQQSKNKMV